MGAGALDQISFAHHAEAAMKHISGEQLGSALRALAADLVEERRHVSRLQRENQALREQIDALQRALAEERGHHVSAQKAA